MTTTGLVIAVAATVFNFGILHERDGEVRHRFMLRNDSQTAVRICQTYPSCGCTTIACDTGLVAPHDSVAVDVSFAPYNRGGDFYETASLVVASQTDTTVVTLAVEGTVITSEETLMRQYPVRQGDLRLTTDTLNMGEVTRGASKTMVVGVMPGLQYDLRQSVPVTFVADKKVGWGKVSRTVKVNVNEDRPKRAPSRTARIVVNAIVIPDFSAEPTSARLPRLSCPKRIDRKSGQLNLHNNGSAPLFIYRAYTDDGTDLIGKRPVSIQPGQTFSLTLTDATKSRSRITLITNDRSRPRTNILLLP